TQLLIDERDQTIPRLSVSPSPRLEQAAHVGNRRSLRAQGFCPFGISLRRWPPVSKSIPNSRVTPTGGFAHVSRGVPGGGGVRPPGWLRRASSVGRSTRGVGPPRASSFSRRQSANGRQRFDRGSRSTSGEPHVSGDPQRVH